MKVPTRTPAIPAVEQFWWKHERGIQFCGVLVLLCAAIASFVH